MIMTLKITVLIGSNENSHDRLFNVKESSLSDGKLYINIK